VQRLPQRLSQRLALGLARELARIPLTVAFAGALAVAEIGYLSLSTRHADRVVAWASTNVDRLTTEPLGPLVLSVFVVGEHRLLWLLLGTLGCAIVELRFGWRRTLLVAVVAQVGGTAVSEGIVWWRVGHDRLPDRALHQVDVGVSYVVVGLLTLAVVTGRPRVLRVIAGAALAVLAPNLLTGLTALEVSPVGHLTAFLAAGIISGVLLVGESRRPRIHDPMRTRTE
jgi:hypothetical protein